MNMLRISLKIGESPPKRGEMAMKRHEDSMSCLVDPPEELEAILGSHARPQQAAKKVTPRPTQICRACDAPRRLLW